MLLILSFSSLSAENNAVYNLVDKKISQHLWLYQGIDSMWFSINLNQDINKIQKVIRLHDILTQYDRSKLSSKSRITFSTIQEVIDDYHAVLEISSDESYVSLERYKPHTDFEGSYITVREYQKNGEYIEKEGKLHFEDFPEWVHDFTLVKNKSDVDNTLILAGYVFGHWDFMWMYILNLETFSLTQINTELYLWNILNSIPYSDTEMLFRSFKDNKGGTQEQVSLCNFMTLSCEILLELNEWETFEEITEMWPGPMYFDLDWDTLTVKYFKSEYNTEYPSLRTKLGEHTITIK